MGVEWEIGCVYCRRYVWLGSRKPAVWEGFQMGNEYVERFFALHTHRPDRPCRLVVHDDVGGNAPWEVDSGVPSDWREDILSRQFWHSFRNRSIVCAQCSRELSSDWTRPPHGQFLRANRGLWFCDSACKAAWVAADGTQHLAEGGPLAPRPYDSTEDEPGLPPGGILVVGCATDKTFVPVDGMLLKGGEVRDFAYLAGYLARHLGQPLQARFVVAEEN
ncbi:MAG: hypothetical protein AAGN35_10000 [Bacteroidota bacterium]